MLIVSNVLISIGGFHNNNYINDKELMMDLSNKVYGFNKKIRIYKIYA